MMLVVDRDCCYLMKMIGSTNVSRKVAKKGIENRRNILPDSFPKECT